MTAIFALLPFIASPSHGGDADRLGHPDAELPRHDRGRETPRIPGSPPCFLKSRHFLDKRTGLLFLVCSPTENDDMEPKPSSRATPGSESPGGSDPQIEGMRPSRKWAFLPSALLAALLDRAQLNVAPAGNGP